jgi:predicted ATPase
VPITELHIEGLRTIERIRLRLDGLNVLIGDNGSGKSSILEACEILRRAALPGFLDDFHRIHGGLTSLLRRGATRLVLGLTLTGEVTSPGAHWEGIRYEIELTADGSFARFRESIRVKPKGPLPKGRPRPPKKSVDADGFVLILSHDGGGEPLVLADGRPDFRTEADAGQTVLGSSGPASAAADPHLLAAALLMEEIRRIQVHLPFEVIPSWAARALDRKSSLRGSALLSPADHLDRLGLNLASAFHALKNGFGRAHWEKTLECVQLGLGQHIEDVVTWADPGGGNVGLSLKIAGLDLPIPTSQLSDGMLSYLAFVALFRLDRKPPSLLAFDEPDLHLHPHLLMRVLDFFETMAQDRPVLLATHSDRLLDALRAPERSVVLCEVGPDGATRLLRPDAGALARWLERYRGLGDLRGAGHAASVLTKPEPP